MFCDFKYHQTYKCYCVNISGFKPRTNGHQVVQQQYATRTRKNIYSFRNPYAARGSSGPGAQFSYTQAIQGKQLPVATLSLKKSFKKALKSGLEHDIRNKPLSNVMSISKKQNINMEQQNAQVRAHNIDHILQRNKGLIDSIGNLIVDAIETSGHLVDKKPLKKGPIVETGIKSITSNEASSGKVVTKPALKQPQKALVKKTKEIYTAPVPKQTEEKTPTKTTIKAKPAAKASLGEKEQAPAAEKEEGASAVTDVVDTGLSSKTNSKIAQGVKPSAKTETTEASPVVEAAESTEPAEANGIQRASYAEYMADEYCSCMPRCPSGTIFRGYCGHQWSFGMQRSLCCFDTFYDDDDDDR